MAEHVIFPKDISLPLARDGDVIVLHGSLSSFLIYPTYDVAPFETEQFALIECTLVSLSRFGYPNDEGVPEHRLYDKGFSKTRMFGEVIESQLIEEYEAMHERSIQRIWADRLRDPRKFPRRHKRHFIFSFKEDVFEVVCEELRIIGMFPDCATAYQEAFTKLSFD